jgi:hypothetical protein
MVLENLSLEQISQNDEAAFRAMVLAYWQEIMPKASVVRDEKQREDYFQQ